MSWFSAAPNFRTSVEHYVGTRERPTRSELDRVVVSSLDTGLTIQNHGDSFVIQGSATDPVRTIVFADVFDPGREALVHFSYTAKLGMTGAEIQEALATVIAWQPEFDVAVGPDGKAHVTTTLESTREVDPRPSKQVAKLVVQSDDRGLTRTHPDVMRTNGGVLYLKAFARSGGGAGVDDRGVPNGKGFLSVTLPGKKTVSVETTADFDAAHNGKGGLSYPEELLEALAGKVNELPGFRAETVYDGTEVQLRVFRLLKAP